MPAPSQPLPGHWPQLSNWQVHGGEAPERDRTATQFTSIRNRLPEGHAIREASVARGSQAIPRETPCQGVHVNDYMHNVLAALVTPKEGCPSRRYARNAELRHSVATALALHPEGGTALLEARLKSLGLPSLLRDEPQYLPGTLEALRYDVGAQIVAIGQSALPDLADVDTPGDGALHEAGARELSYLDSDSPHAEEVLRDHRRILDFHYGAAGVNSFKAYEALQALEAMRRIAFPSSVQLTAPFKSEAAAIAAAVAKPDVPLEQRLRNARHQQHRIATFIGHIERCRQRAEPPPFRSSTASTRGRMPVSAEPDAPRARRKAADAGPPPSPPSPPYSLSREHDPRYNCTLL
ncbi:hypothetical protein [Pandoraea oxalativorans]|uniref:Uncharacterized protein n=1 Tax=Pandoraea oxalativorans TaxID=573737 RepID=A0A0E3YDM6_9BURK|nr:hypothetical protein [Pandoraea oxalativorans]AKC71642.2 hypothetical protein MB84_22590 [Pandoraea oxalativorans]